jgi:hypothetical protein
MLVIFAVKSTAVSVASNNSLKFAAESSVLVLDSVAARFEEIDPGHIHNFNDQSANCKKKKKHYKFLPRLTILSKLCLRRGCVSLIPGLVRAQKTWKTKNIMSLNY